MAKNPDVKTLTLRDNLGTVDPSVSLLALLEEFQKEEKLPVTDKELVKTLRSLVWESPRFRAFFRSRFNA